MRTIGTIYINSGLKETKLKGDQSGTNRTNWNRYTQLRPTPRAKLDHTGPYRTIQDHTGPSRTKQDKSGQFWTKLDLEQPYRMI